MMGFTTNGAHGRWEHGTGAQEFSKESSLYTFSVV
jgi:hypothetical protein